MISQVLSKNKNELKEIPNDDSRNTRQRIDVNANENEENEIR